MARNQIKALHFSVRPRVVARYTGQLLLVYGILSSVPLLFSLATGEFELLWPYIGVIAGAVISGFLLAKLKTTTDIQNNEALVISGLIFVAVPAFAAVPFYQQGLTLIDALFESVSGVTTTGLSCLATVETLPRSFLFARSWLQWVGGLGIVVLSVAIILPQSKATLQLFRENWEKEGMVAGTRSYARIILLVYLVLTLAGIVLLLILGSDWFDSVSHVLASVSTGGFSRYDNSLSGLAGGFPVQTAVMIISCLGALPLVMYYYLVRGEWSKFFGSLEIRGVFLVFLFAVAVMNITFLTVDRLSLPQALKEGMLIGLSAQTTTGFSTLPVAELSAAAKFVLILLMLIGGNIGSTAGGIKILRLLIVLEMLRNLIVRSGQPPKAVLEPRLLGRRLESVEIERCFLVVFLFFGVIILSLSAFLFMGYPFLDSLFEVVSAVCTVGLSAGISSPDLPVLLKSVLCLDMLMGRLEIIAFLVIFYPPTWFGKKRGV